MVVEPSYEARLKLENKGRISRRWHGKIVARLHIVYWQEYPKVKEKPGAATEADPGQSYLVSVSSLAIFSSMAALMYAVTERPWRVA